MKYKNIYALTHIVYNNDNYLVSQELIYKSFA